MRYQQRPSRIVRLRQRWCGSRQSQASGYPNLGFACDPADFVNLVFKTLRRLHTRLCFFCQAPQSPPVFAHLAREAPGTRKFRGRLRDDSADFHNFFVHLPLVAYRTARVKTPEFPSFPISFPRQSEA